MFLAKPLRLRADLVCARSYAGRAPFFGAALFLCPADPVRQVDSRIPACDPAAGIAPRKHQRANSACELSSYIPGRDPAMRTTLANSGERIYLAILSRVCGHRCLRSRFCACLSNQSRASARCSLDPRIRSASHIYVTVDSWRGRKSACAKGASRLGRRA